MKHTLGWFDWNAPGKNKARTRTSGRPAVATAAGQPPLLPSPPAAGTCMCTWQRLGSVEGKRLPASLRCCPCAQPPHRDPPTSTSGRHNLHAPPLPLSAGQGGLPAGTPAAAGQRDGAHPAQAPRLLSQPRTDRRVAPASCFCSLFFSSWSVVGGAPWRAARRPARLGRACFWQCYKTLQRGQARGAPTPPPPPLE
jgi:hypothetical protein